MSRQFGYFAMGSDKLLVCETVLAAFPDLSILPDRGTREQMIPHAIRAPEELLACDPQAGSILIPSNLTSSIVFRQVAGDNLWVDYRSCPVLEFIPSVMVGADTVREGRIAYFYGDDPYVVPQLNKLFRALKRAARKLPKRPGSWIFKEAESKAKWLDDWVGAPIRNPLIGEP